MTSVNFPQSERDQNKRQWKGLTVKQIWKLMCLTPRTAILGAFSWIHWRKAFGATSSSVSYRKLVKEPDCVDTYGYTHLSLHPLMYHLSIIIDIIMDTWIHPYILGCILYWLLWIHVSIPISSDESFIYYNGFMHPSLHSLIYHFNSSVPESNFIPYPCLTN